MNFPNFIYQGEHGILKYQDTSTGKPVVDLYTKLGKCDCMTHNPYNAVIHLGHYNGMFGFFVLLLLVRI